VLFLNKKNINKIKRRIIMEAKLKRHENVDPTEVKFRHIRFFDDDSNIDNRGGITVAYKETTPTTIEYAVARCNPSDNFSRKRGRILAAGRLKSDNWKESVNMTFGEFHSNIHNMV